MYTQVDGERSETFSQQLVEIVRLHADHVATPIPGAKKQKQQQQKQQQEQRNKQQAELEQQRHSKKCSQSNSTSKREA